MKNTHSAIETFIPRIRQRLDRECRQLRQAILNHVYKNQIPVEQGAQRLNQIHCYEQYTKNKAWPRLNMELQEWENCAMSPDFDNFCFGGQKLIFKNDPATWTRHVWGSMCFEPGIRPVNSLGIWHKCKVDFITSINLKLIASCGFLDVKIWDTTCNFYLLATLHITECKKVVPIDDNQMGTLDVFGVFRVWSLNSFECNHVVCLPKTLLEIDHVKDSTILIMNGGEVELWCWVSRSRLWRRACPVGCPFILIPKFEVFLEARRLPPYGLQLVHMTLGAIDGGFLSWSRAIANIFALDHNRFLICNTLGLDDGSRWSIVNIQERAVGSVQCMSGPCPRDSCLAGITKNFLVFYNAEGVFLFDWLSKEWIILWGGLSKCPQQVVCQPNRVLILAENKVYIKDFDCNTFECFFI